MIKEISFKGGLSSSADYFSVAEGQCPLFFDDVQLEYGVLKGRNPMRPVSTGSIGSDVFFSIFSFQDSNGPFVYAATTHAGAGKIYRSSVYWQTSQLTTPVAYSDVTGTFNAGVSGVVADVLNGILVVVPCDGANKPGKFTSNTVNCADLGGSPPTDAITCKMVNNYMFLARQRSSIVRWSNPSDPETWPSGNSISFNDKDGDYITALGRIGTDLIIFKSSSIGKLSTISNGTTLGPLSTIFNGIGCMSPNALDNLSDGTLAFWGSDGDVYITDGYTFESIGNPPYPKSNIYASLIGALTSPSSSQLRFYPQRNEIWVNNVFMNTTSMYAYDIRQKYWRRINGTANSCLGVVKVMSPVSGSTYPNFIFGSYGSTSILCLDDFLNNSTSILDGAGATVTGKAEMSIRLPENLSESSIYGLSIIYSPASVTRAVTGIGYDGTFSSNPITLSGSSKYRWDLNNRGFSLSNNQRPATMQISFSTTRSDDKLYAMYVYSSLGA